jgi:hypothetical protein
MYNIQIALDEIDIVGLILLVLFLKTLIGSHFGPLEGKFLLFY